MGTPYRCACPSATPNPLDDRELLAHSAAYALRAHGIDAQVVVVSTLAAIEAEVLRLKPQIVALDLHLGALGRDRRRYLRLDRNGAQRTRKSSNSPVVGI
jgi:hypothetical protein